MPPTQQNRRGTSRGLLGGCLPDFLFRRSTLIVLAVIAVAVSIALQMYESSMFDETRWSEHLPVYQPKPHSLALRRGPFGRGLFATVPFEKDSAVLCVNQGSLPLSREQPVWAPLLVRNPEQSKLSGSGKFALAVCNWLHSSPAVETRWRPWLMSWIGATKDTGSEVAVPLVWSKAEIDMLQFPIVNSESYIRTQHGIAIDEHQPLAEQCRDYSEFRRVFALAQSRWFPPLEELGRPRSIIELEQQSSGANASEPVFLPGLDYVNAGTRENATVSVVRIRKDKEVHVCLKTKRAIEAGEELLMYYGALPSRITLATWGFLTPSVDDDESVLVTMPVKVLQGREQELAPYVEIAGDLVRFELRLNTFPVSLIGFTRLVSAGFNTTVPLERLFCGPFVLDKCGISIENEAMTLKRLSIQIDNTITSMKTTIHEDLNVLENHRAGTHVISARNEIAIEYRIVLKMILMSMEHFWTNPIGGQQTSSSGSSAKPDDETLR